MSDFFKRYRVVAVWCVGVLLLSGDFVIKRFPHWRQPISIEVAFDRFIPFDPTWAWVYLIGWLAIIFGGGAWYLWETRSNWPAVRQLLLAGVIMQVGAWIIHVAFPTYMPRPELPAELTDASLRLINRIYTVDPSSHVLPSQHVASVTILAWFLSLKGISWQSVLGWVVVALVSLSVLYTKQHGILDVFTGFAWGFVSCHIGYYYGAERERRVWLLPLDLRRML